ncbi:DUF748 domain-containing protein [Rugamonas apoptosis]|uniref:DUF748 domain-containing protein n=1 Tax=Rugamonas apoptosis TaxID=2758570 RepID=A0A7W2FA96_9BURK|nr:DUF748 domain-containing protein [Rugamonas apoptosis]MBA5687879.1 DUF748 domain-containing protein [Rugamonas apoptosis]
MEMRWKRWVAGGAGVMAVYAGAGFGLLPQIIKIQVPKIGQSVLERQMSVGDVRFNPYTLRLEVVDFRLAEANGAPLFSAGQLTVDLEWRSLFRRAWTLAEVRLTAPQALLAVGADGSFNIAQLMDTLNRRPHEESSGMPRLSIASLVLEQGKLTLRDQRAGYADEYTPIDFKLANLSTLPDENGSYTFSADATGGGTLRWRGDASLNPIGGKGELVLDKVALPGVAAYLKPYTRASVTAGLLSAKLPYHFSYQDGKFDAGLDGAALGVHDLAVAQGTPAATFAALKTFELTGVQANLATRSASIERLSAADGKFSLHRNAKGELDLAQLGAPETPKPATAAVPTAPSAPAASAGSVAAAPTPAKAASTPSASSTANATPAPAKPSAPPPPWKLQLKQLDFDRLAFDAIDETASPALKVSMAQAQLHLHLQAEQAPAGVKLNLDGATFSLADLTIASGSQTPFKLGELGFTDGSIDLAGHRATFGRLYADGGQLQLAFDAKGKLALLDHLPGGGKAAPTADKSPAAGKPAPASSTASVTTTAAKPGAAPATAPEATAGTPWQVNAKSVELNKFSAAYSDQGTGIKANVQDFNLRLDDVSNDLKQAIKFQAGLAVREGGKLSAQGSLVPATGAVDTAVEVKQLALAPVQPMLAKFVKLKLASGTVSARGQLSTKPGPANRTSVRYVGAFDVSNLALNEDDGDRFASWKAVRTDKLTLSMAPDLLDIPELRIVEPNAKLIIENDRSLNAARLLVEPANGAASSAPVPAAGTASVPAKPAASVASASPAAKTTVAAAKPAAPASQPFPVHVQRMRLQNAKLDFTDLSLRPQFSAKIYELGGVITGLSSKRDARSQVELDGRVDEFGMARVRGQLNPFAASENTDLNVIFKNVDMVSASPYTMKFAGYKIAQGKISLDLEYKVRQNQLQGNNHIVLDQLTLGERIDSPDALKLPLELALAILKDSDGRIDLGLPVAGDMNDPQFSYGAVVWKAVGNVLTKIVTAPFRALGNLFGISGDKLEAISFDPGSEVLLPPERAKLAQVAQILAKRAQLTLAVPGQYSEQADGAALRGRAVRREIAKRAGIKLEAGEEPGPLDLNSSPVRSALRSLYGERFGSAELDKEKKAAEAAAAVPVAATSTASASEATAANAASDAPNAQPAPGQKKLAVWQKLGKLIQGEPQVADASGFYRALQTKLEQRQALPADALTRLGTLRASAIVAALTEGGVNPASTRATAPEAVPAEVGQPVNLKLGLSAK